MQYFGTIPDVNPGPSPGCSSRRA